MPAALLRCESGCQRQKTGGKDVREQRADTPSGMKGDNERAARERGGEMRETTAENVTARMGPRDTRRLYGRQCV